MCKRNGITCLRGKDKNIGITDFLALVSASLKSIRHQEITLLLDVTDAY